MAPPAEIMLTVVTALFALLVPILRVIVQLWNLFVPVVAMMITILVEIAITVFQILFHFFAFWGGALGVVIVTVAAWLLGVGRVLEAGVVFARRKSAELSAYRHSRRAALWHVTLAECVADRRSLLCVAVPRDVSTLVRDYLR